MLTLKLSQKLLQHQKKLFGLKIKQNYIVIFLINQKNIKLHFYWYMLLINKPYILDLTKGGSLVEYLVNRGFDVYLLDWGTPGYEDKNMKLDDYIMDYIPRAVKKVLRKSNVDEVSILGYCMGGTMTSIFAALHPELPIRNIVFMTSPFDFEDTGFMVKCWMRNILILIK